MRLIKLLPVLSFLLLVFGCFLPWITVESKSLTITGVATAGTSFGRPAYFHFLWGGLFIFFFLIGKVWAKRIALVMAAFNIAWALRNFFLLPACSGGECPVRHSGLYLVLISSLLLFSMLAGDSDNKRPVPR